MPEDMGVFVVCLRRESQVPAPVLLSSMRWGIDGFYVVAFVGFVVVRVYGVVPCFWPWAGIVSVTLGEWYMNPRLERGLPLSLRVTSILS
jgi:hypothetical protein